MSGPSAAGSRRRLAISLTVSGLSGLYAGDARRLVGLARQAEDAGIDQLLLPDHLAIGPRSDRYPYAKRYPLPLDEPFPEPLVTLAAMAAATSTIRLGTGILISPLRPPLLLAKQAATLDVLSGGRLDLGVGVGWQREEFAGSGVPFAARWRALDEGLRACRALWCDDPTVFEWQGERHAELRAFPKPLQPGGVPVWLGAAATERGARRMAEHCAGWMPMDSSPDDLRAGIDRIHAALRAAGRTTADFGVRAHAPVTFVDRRPDLERTLAALPALHEAGATAASFALGLFCRSADEVVPFLERIGGATA